MGPALTMRQIGLELTAVDTEFVAGGERFVLYFGQNNEAIVNLMVERDAPGKQR
jgi:hypothetical protein